MALFTREGDLIQVTVQKLYLFTAIVAVAGFGGGAIFASTYLSAQSTSSGQGDGQSAGVDGPSTQDRLAAGGRHTIGPADAAVTIVEFTDYDCAYCRRYYSETFPQIMETYGDRIRYVVRHFPLAQMHPEAVKAAEAAECAAEDGRFWEYHDLLMRGVPSLDIESLKQYAVDVGVNSAEFNRCLDEDVKAVSIQQDLRDAYMHGVRGTPSFFVNGYSLSGAQPIDVFTAYIEAAMTAEGQ